MDKKHVVFITDNLGYKCGGCSTINYELVIALKQISIDADSINCLIINDSEPDSPLEKQIENIGIKITYYNTENKILEDDECRRICDRIFDHPESHYIYWIGHDVFTGGYANKLAEWTKSESVVCIHTDYDTIEGLKNNSISGIEKEGKQREIIQNAGKVFAVGPRLLKRVKEIRVDDVYELVPGMTEVEEEGRLKNNRAVISYGRFDGTIKSVKQTDLVFAAFGKAVSLMNNNEDYVLHIIGTPESEEETRLREIAENFAGRKLSINFHPYTQNRELLYKTLKNNSVGLMLSLTEGFGLTGWEMISVGLPLIVTERSGLYDFLEQRFGNMIRGMCLPVSLKGAYDEKINKDDVQNVAGGIVQVFQKTEQFRIAAKEMHQKLKKYTWYRTAREFAIHLNLKTEETDEEKLYSETYKTKKGCVINLLNRMEMDEIGKDYIIFFGGISSFMCEENIIKKLEHWLDRDKQRKLYLCYESGKAIQQRAKELDEMKLDTDNGLPQDPIERLKAKERNIVKSKDKYSNTVSDQVGN